MGIRSAGADIIQLEVRVVVQNILRGNSLSQQAEDEFNRDSHVADNRLSAKTSGRAVMRFSRSLFVVIVMVLPPALCAASGNLGVSPWQRQQPCKIDTNRGFTDLACLRSPQLDIAFILPGLFAASFLGDFDMMPHGAGKRSSGTACSRIGASNAVVVSRDLAGTIKRRDPRAYTSFQSAFV